jgi:hypothetical protein
LLGELVKAGHIRAKVRWKNIYKLLAEDERYLNLLGTPGSNPIELFWDVVDQFDQALEEKVAKINRALESKGAKFSVTMSEEGLREAIKGSRDVEGMSDNDIVEVYNTVSAFRNLRWRRKLILGFSLETNSTKKRPRKRERPSDASDTRLRTCEVL